MTVEIRELVFEDIDFILEIENNKDIWKVSNTTEDFTKEEIEHFIAKNTVEGLKDGQKRWIITKDKIAVGCLDLFDYDKKNSRAGIGIVIHKDHQNQGIAKKSLQQFISFAKDVLFLHQLYCSIFADNIFSVKLFSKLGFKETGLRKDWCFYNDKYYDEIFYQLIF